MERRAAFVAPFRRHGLVETIEVGQSGNVSLNIRDITADRLHGCVELSLTPAHDEDVGTLSYEELCGSQPCPGCATSNHGYFPLQLLIFGHRIYHRRVQSL
jgi:hypothetical protein